MAYKMDLISKTPASSESAPTTVYPQRKPSNIDNHCTMIRSFFVSFALLVTLPAALAVTYNAEFAACVTHDYLPDGMSITGEATGVACANACYNLQAYSYSAFDASDSSCLCSDTSFASENVTTGSAGGCGSNYEVYVTHTTWDFLECTSNYYFTGGISGTSSDYDSIFASCANYPYMAIWPSGTFYWACGSGTITGDASITCDYQIVRLYTHPADATASGLARRSLDFRRRLLEQDHLAVRYCPHGMTACALEGDEHSYECLDTQSELESCGGCLYGTYVEPGAYNTTVTYGGQDCSAVKNVALGDSTCLDGKCNFHCKRGYEQRGGQCVKA